MQSRDPMERMTMKRPTFRQVQDPLARLRRYSDTLALNRQIRALVAPTNKRIEGWQKRAAFLRALADKRAGVVLPDLAPIKAEVLAEATALGEQLDRIAGSRANSRAADTERALRSILTTLESLQP